MRRAFERRRDPLEDIEDNQWRRKSYALAQHNSVPVPMPLPIYPAPKVVPMPTSVPPRRTRPYRPPPPSYRSPPPTHPPPEPPTGSPPDLLMPELPARPPPELPARNPPELPTRPPPPAAPPRSGRRKDSPALPALTTSPVSGGNQAVTVLAPLEEEDLLGPLPPSPPLTSPSPPPSLASTSLSHLPPTPTPQTLPDTPSLSRTDTPSSLTCPRTPTSIRAAPWQPPTPLQSTPTSLSTTPTPRPARPTSLATTPSPLPSPPPSPFKGEPTDYPPTPTSTHTDDGVDQKTSAMDADVEDNQDDEFYKAPREERQSSPLATLDVTQLKADLRMVGLGNGIAQPTSPTDTSSPSVTSIDITRPPLEGPVKMAVFEGGYRSYRTRFWILGVFSMLAFLQSMVWGTWAPIVDSAQVAFGWSDAMVAAFPNWGPVVVVTFTIPMMWITQKMGLRLGVVACAALICSGTLVRCFTSQPELFTILCHVGAVLNSFAACMTLSLPAMVAAVWFPPGERITATAVGALMCQLGGAAMYMGPLVVRSPNVPATLSPIFHNAYPSTPPSQYRPSTPFYRGPATTHPYFLRPPTPTPLLDVTPFPPTTTAAPLTPEDIRGDIMHLMYIHFALAATMLVAAASYFPARPPSPPSATSAQDKPDFLSGLKSIVRNVQMLLVLGVYSFSFGVPVVWIGVLTLSLRLVDLDQTEAMGVAVVAVVVSSTAAFLTAFVTDKMYGHLRNTIVALLLGSTACFVWFLLLSTRTIEPSLAQVYVCVTGAMSLEFASVPLLVELAVELGYPIPESVTGAALTLLFNVVALIFLGLFQVPSDYLWVSYTLVACVSLSIVPLLFVKETHKRSQTDMKT